MNIPRAHRRTSTPGVTTFRPHWHLPSCPLHSIPFAAIATRDDERRDGSVRLVPTCPERTRAARTPRSAAHLALPRGRSVQDLVSSTPPRMSEYVRLARLRGCSAAPRPPACPPARPSIHPSRSLRARGAPRPSIARSQSGACPRTLPSPSAPPEPFLARVGRAYVQRT